MFKGLLYKIISFSIIPIAFFSVQRWSNSPIGSTVFWWLMQAIVLFLFWRGISQFTNDLDKRNMRFVKWYLFWCLISIFRGFFIAELYWDWRALIGNGMGLLIAMVAYLTTNKLLIQSIFRKYVFYALPLAVVIFPFLPLNGWGWYLFPISVLMIFFPIMKFNWKLVLFLITLLAIFADITTRSHIIKFSIPIVIITIFYYLGAFFNSTKYLSLACLIFLILPWFFFTLAVFGVFNVLNMSEYIKGDFKPKSSNTIGGGVQQQPLTSDSRSFLYEEVLNSAVKYNYWMIGRCPARGNETIFFGKDAEKVTGRKERVRNEANILNVFTWMGIIGVMLYFLVFYQASYLAISHSNNLYSKMIGLFVAFRWMYAWVEDWSSFNLNVLVIWMMIGVCFSREFREMSDSEVKLWLRGIFSKRYFDQYRLLLFENSAGLK